MNAFVPFRPVRPQSDGTALALEAQIEVEKRTTEPLGHNPVVQLRERRCIARESELVAVGKLPDAKTHRREAAADLFLVRAVGRAQHRHVAVERTFVQRLRRGPPAGHQHVDEREQGGGHMGQSHSNLQPEG